MNKKKIKGIVDKREFMAYRPCKTYYWLKRHKPAKEIVSMPPAKILADGRIAEKMALLLFPHYFYIDPHSANPVKLTAQLIKEKTYPYLYKPQFASKTMSFKGDIIRVEEDGLTIYEIKSGVRSNGRYKRDAAFQKAVLEDLGYTVKGTFLVLLSHEYKRQGVIEPKEMFQLLPVDEWLDTEEIRASVHEMTKLFPKCPPVVISDACNGCGYFSVCFHQLPSPSVFDFSRLQFHAKKKLYEEGRLSPHDYLSLPESEQSPYVVRQIAALSKEEPLIEKENLRAFLDTLSYPLGFLDFETITPLIPLYDGFGPYDPVVTQYSYHRLPKEGAPYEHTEFLGDGLSYPEEELVRRLLEDTKNDATVLMYSQAEKILLGHLAERLPAYAEKIHQLCDKLCDLETPFLSMDYYQKELHGKSSIKQVLPTLFPGDPSLSYDALEIHDGAAANELYESLRRRSPEEREHLRRALLTYCQLDTWAMVKIWEKLKEAL